MPLTATPWLLTATNIAAQTVAHRFIPVGTRRPSATPTTKNGMDREKVVLHMTGRAAKNHPRLSP